MRTENPTLLLHFELGPLQSSPMSGRHSTGWAAPHMLASLKVRTEFPTLLQHSKLGASEVVHVFSRQVDRRCVALEVHLPQDSSCSSRLATELPAAAPEFEDAAGAWSPLHAGRAARHL